MRILYCEPFEAGSHARFTEALTGGIEADWTRLTLPGRHWKWRMRSAAVHWVLSNEARLARGYDLLIASSYVPLAELVGLVPSLAGTPRLLVFHENQLAYPVRDEHTGERDLHYGLTQMTSALAASACVFNSRHNRDSFLSGAEALLERMPDPVPPGWVEQIAARCRVLPLPLELPEGESTPDDPDPVLREAGPIILWNHRWEYDKGPDRFFGALAELSEREVPFRLAVCGQRFRQAPAIFERARRRLSERIVHWGTVTDRDAYWRLLRRAHIAVSTANHEFFGVAMLEAAHAGAFPLVPDRLVYPEHFPESFRYGNDDELVRRLAELCRAWVRGERALRADRRELTDRYRADRVLPRYRELFETLATSAPSCSGRRRSGGRE